MQNVPVSNLCITLLAPSAVIPPNMYMFLPSTTAEWAATPCGTSPLACTFSHFMLSVNRLYFLKNEGSRSEGHFHHLRQMQSVKHWSSSEFKLTCIKRVHIIVEFVSSHASMNVDLWTNYSDNVAMSGWRVSALCSRLRPGGRHWESPKDTQDGQTFKGVD